jgi:hypothetical protein
MRKLFTALFLIALVPAGVAADTTTMQIKTRSGIESREVTRALPASAGVPSPAGRTFYYGGWAEDGVRRFNTDGTGSYIDGENKGEFIWGFATKEGQPVIKSFKEWGEAYHAESNEPAAQLYIVFTSGERKGVSYTEVVGWHNSATKIVFVSPIFYTRG